jgi:hypothetical protein
MGNLIRLIRPLVVLGLLAQLLAGIPVLAQSTTKLCVPIPAQPGGIAGCQDVTATFPLPTVLPGVVPGAPLPVTVSPRVITWIAPTSGSVTASGTVVAAGPTVSIITNTTGGARLTLNLAGEAAVDNVGIPLGAGERVTINGQPTGTAITGVCSTGTCTFAVQSGS